MLGTVSLYDHLISMKTLELRSEMLYGDERVVFKLAAEIYRLWSKKQLAQVSAACVST